MNPTPKGVDMLDIPQAGPDHSGRPHLTRTAVILALIAVTLYAVLAIAVETQDVRIPPEVVRPGWYVTNNPDPSGTMTPSYAPAEVWGR